MFPIPWNFPLRKKNGNLVNIGDAIDAGTEIPEHDEGDAGKVLSVDRSGNLEWSDEVNSEIQTLTNNLADEIIARAELGAHNIFPITIESLKSLNTSGTWSDNSYTYYGITYVCEVTNGYVTKITVSGTATATSALDLFGKNNAFVTNKYKGNILSGSPSGGSGTSYCIIEQTSSSSAGTSPGFSRDDGNGTIIGDNDYARMYIRIEGDYAISGSLIFNPMIRLASDTDNTYQPYSMTNKELTDKVVIKDVTITPATGVTFDYNGTYKIGNLVILNFRFILDAGFTVATDTPIATIDAAPLDSSILAPAAMAWDGEVGGILGIMNNNVIKLATSAHFVASKSYVVNTTYVCK